MPISRNQQNYIIMSVIYMELDNFHYGEEASEVKSRDLMLSMLEEYEVYEIPPFIEDSVNLALSNYGIIKDFFTPNLVGWKWERLPLLTESILLMSYVRNKYIDHAPKAVVIDVAVNLAKQYIDEKQAKFIHAILDKSL